MSAPESIVVTMKLPLTLCSFATASLIAATAHAASEPNTNAEPKRAQQDEVEVIVVTANKIKQPLFDVAGSVAVLAAEELESKGVTELYDALRHEPGVTVTGGAGRPQNIAIRGITGNRIAIIQDGIRSADGYGASDLNDQMGRNSFDLANIKSIEIVKGPSSSTLGSGAIGGAVIIKSKQAADYLRDNAFYLDASGTYTGISDKYKGSSNLAFRLGQSEHLLSVSGWEGEESRNFNLDLYNRALDGYSTAYSSQYHFTDSLMLDGRVSTYQANQIRHEGSASIQPDGKWDIEEFFEDESVTSYRAHLGLEYVPTQTGWLEQAEAKIFWRQTEQDEQTSRLMSRLDQNNIQEKRKELEAKTFSDDLWGIKAELLGSLFTGSVEHQLAAGLNVSGSSYQRTDHDRVLDSNGQSNKQKTPFAPANEYELGIYWRDMMELERWILTTGLRFDAHQLKPENLDQIGGFGIASINSTELSPSFSATFKASKALNLYLSYNHGFRAPTYDKAFGYVLHDFVPLTPFVIVPNLELKAETSDAIELGSKYESGGFALHTSAFYQRFSDFIDIKDLGLDKETFLYRKQYRNFSGARIYGAELSASYWLTSHWQASTKLGYVNGKKDNDEYVRSVTPLEGSAELAYQNAQFQGYALLSWAGSMSRVPECQNDLSQVTPCATTSSWLSVDLGASYKPMPKLTLSSTLVNLFDRNYTRYQDVAGVAASDAHYSTQSGRYFTFNMRYEF